MSADLYAAFGGSEQIPGKPHIQGHSARIVHDDIGSSVTEGTVFNAHRGASESPSESTLWRKDQSGVDVLFDASEDAQAEDEFGDFEEAPTENDLEAHKSDINHPHAGAIVDLLGLGEENSRSVQDPSSISNFEARDAHATLGSRPVASIGADEQWGDFSQAPSRPELPSEPAVETLGDLPQEEDWEPFENEDEESDGRVDHAIDTQGDVQSREEHELRPANVPPPAILLEIIPQILARVQRNLTKESGSKDLEVLINTHFAITHIIAGRSLRWKRDFHLSQGMKIGPAGGMGGMKLASIHKTEDLKEEREISEVVSTWKRYASFFNAKAKEWASKSLVAVKDDLRVRTCPGALTATHPCALCGLRRDERVNLIDMNVEDSFGEWWIEHWGHTRCKEWWAAQRGLLARR